MCVIIMVEWKCFMEKAIWSKRSIGNLLLSELVTAVQAGSGALGVFVFVLNILRL